ncbi:hypothetical protein AUP68_07546 [Ilyonectria robusta]
MHPLSESLDTLSSSRRPQLLCHIYRDIGFRMYHAIEAFFLHHRRPSPPASSSASSPIS